MNRWFGKLFGSLLFLFIIYFNLPLLAQSPDDIKVHVSQESAVPGHILEPGDYIFHRVNSDQPGVYSLTRMQDHPEFVGYFQVEPTQRNSRENSEVEYSAPDAAGVRLIQAWYGPGNTDGYQFLYTQRDLRKLDQMAAARWHKLDTAAGEP